jgi:hypothetical protein
VRHYALGGLVPGQRYTVYAAVDERTDSTYGSAAFTATAGTVTRPVTVGTPTLTLRGRVDGAAGGTVTIRAQGAALPLLARSGKVDGTGHYVVRGLIPAAYEAVVDAADLRDRVRSVAVPLTLTASGGRDLVAGPRSGTVRARFRSGAAPVRDVGGGAGDAAGELLFLHGDAGGRATSDTVRPGTYRFRPATWASAVPATDGPWWFAPPRGGFTVLEGEVTDLGTVALSVHAR